MYNYHELQRFGQMLNITIKTQPYHFIPMPLNTVLSHVVKYFQWLKILSVQKC